MPHRFRFGVQVSRLPAQGWKERVRRIEALGFATFFAPDHFGPQLDPVSLLAGVASITDSLHIGSLVFGVDYRHPWVYARTAATLQRISGGRCELGIGAGWKRDGDDQAGLPYDPAGVRIERLEQTLRLLSGLRADDRPALLVGGGGRKILSLAARHADIVGINPRLSEGRIGPRTSSDLAPERLRTKLGWIRRAALLASRDPDALELTVQPYVIEISSDPKRTRDALAAESGMTETQVSECPLFLMGSSWEICDQLVRRRTETGISYIVIPGNDAEIVEHFADAIVRELRDH